MSIWDQAVSKAGEGWNTTKGNVEGINWNPKYSSANTGAGTPWSAGNTNTPGSYADIAGSMLLSPSPAPGDPVAGAIFTKTGGLDMGGQQREEDTQRKNKEAEAAAGVAQNQAREAEQATKTAADIESGKQAATEKASSLEDAWNKAYNPAKTRRIYGGY